MALDARTHVRRRFGEEYCFEEKNISADLAKSRPMSPKAQLEQEKRIRREIANSNERRRMQCINAGFQSLRELMPQLSGEKLSKAAILQHTTEYIAKLEQDYKRLTTQNEQFKRMVIELSHERDLQDESPPPKRKKRDTESSDEGIGMGESTSDGSKDLPSVDDVHRELLEVRQQLERERLLRMMTEERVRSLETQLVHSQSRHLSSHLPSPINLKVESHISKTSYNVQEISAPDAERSSSVGAGQPASELAYNPSPRRNLENLVEAIRQIEGDRALGDCTDDHLRHHRHHHHHPSAAPVLNSEESEKDSSVSDPEESLSSKSEESSGRDSPSPLGLCAARRLGLSPATTGVSGTTPQAAHQGMLSEKYPIASHLLHRPAFNHQYYRPGVIVHKS